jgi:hypothetical protein
LAIDARELALILQGVEPPTRKQRVKTLVKRAREKALRISEAAATEAQHERRRRAARQ